MSTPLLMPDARAATRAVRIRSASKVMAGDLALPPDARGVVLFAHGSGSSRFSERNRLVAAELQRAGMATLLVDLLTETEAAEDEATGRHRFDIDLLARRVDHAVDWLAHIPATRHLPIGIFGASTGAAAALVAAAERPEDVQAVVSRGGRPDLAGDALPLVRAPTLLIVGGNDVDVLRLNRAAQARLGGPSKLEIIRGATHLFPERGALEAVAVFAGKWFARHLTGPVILESTGDGW